MWNVPSASDPNADAGAARYTTDADSWTHDTDPHAHTESGTNTDSRAACDDDSRRLGAVVGQALS